MKRSQLIPALFLSLAAAFTALPASAQTGTVTVEVKGVRNSTGNLLANLCAEGGQFPGPCMTHMGLAKAEEGTTSVGFIHVPPGRYALQIFHDEDQNMMPNIPPEGFAFGNDASYPPTFDTAAITVSGDTTVRVTMQYLPAPKAAAKPAMHGVAAPAGTTRADVRDNGLNGVLYRPEGNARVPAIIVLGGSEGGLQGASSVGSAFAQHGYAVLALAYFMDDGLPQTLENIPLEYFDKAVDWLKAQPGIDGGEIGVVGGSRGSEAALLLASRRADIKAAAAFAPSGIVWQGLNFANPMNMGPAWTLDGKPLPYLMPDGMAYRPGAPMKPMFDHALAQIDAHPGVHIPVEQINGPILLVSGKADALWPSFEMSEAIVKRLGDKGFKYPVEHLSYDTAGHMVFAGDPASPSAQAGAKVPANPVLGGNGEANAAAWANNWPKALAFFDAALKE